MASLVTTKQPDDPVLVKRVRDLIKKLRRKLAKENENDGAAWVSVTGVIGFDGAGELPQVTPSADGGARGGDGLLRRAAV